MRGSTVEPLKPGPRLACALICYRRAVRLEVLTSNNP
jgi:hypothetical protein